MPTRFDQGVDTMAKISHRPWLDQREMHRRWWMPVIDTLNFCRLAPNGLARALEWLSTTRGVDTSELQSWDDLAAWFETHIRMIFNPPDPSVTERPMTRLEFLDSELAWKIRAGLSSGPPPRPKTAKPRSEAGVKPNTNSPLQADLIPVRKNIPANFFATGSCVSNANQSLAIGAPSVRETLTPDDLGDLNFACRINRLWQRGPNALCEFLFLFAAERLLRMPLEQAVGRYLEDEQGDK
jgi:hypothetical protein